MQSAALGPTESAAAAAVVARRQEKRGGSRMRVGRWLVIVVALTFVTGCARTDWIDRTLVIVDVTGA
jgi:hypothetical protein